MKGKRVGVVIATYNGEKYIEEQLNSIFGQTLKPDLIVVSDGHSTDNTVKVCKEFLSKSGINFKLLTSDKRLSVKDNFERGLTNCDTDYIFFSDQDDYWLPSKIENAVRTMNETGSVMVFCNAYITDGELKVGKQTLWQEIDYKPKNLITTYDKFDENFQEELIRRNVVTGMCMAIDVKLLKTILPFSNNTIHDSWIAFIASTQGKVTSINYCDVYYRQHGSNAIGTKNTMKASFSHRNGYLENIKKRLKLVEEVKSKVYNNSYAKNYDLYISYLKRRIGFIEKKQKKPELRQYRKYENKPLMIVLKDIYTRVKQ